MPHRGLEPTSVFWAICDIYEAIGRIIAALYEEQPEPEEPFNYRTPSKEQRNREIIKRYALGQSVQHLSFVFQVSEQRIHQILQGYDG